jgi:hypothetical protein
MNLARYLELSAHDALQNRDQWELVVQKLQAGAMPPKPAARPPAGQVAALVSWVETSYARIDRETPPNPGRVTAHRLNRYEYNNSVRDLLGLDLRAAEEFPADPYGYGFDNIGDALTLSPVLTEKYLKAAEHIANIAIPPAEPLKPLLARYVAERMGQDRQLRISAVHEFPVEGDYTLSSRRYQAFVTSASVQELIYLDGKEVSRQTAPPTSLNPAFEASGVHVTAGLHKVEAEIRLQGAMKLQPFLEDIQIYGPEKQIPPQSAPSYRRIFVCGQHTPDCARRIVESLAHRAYRRPVARVEVDELLSLVATAQSHRDSFDSGIRLALMAILVNPNFLFRIERDPAGSAAIHRITDIELASRLSYFLWSTMPDAELLALAEKNQLHSPAVLQAQTKRLLADPRSRALAENFGGQWLQVRNLDVLKPDPQKFRSFDWPLREAMRTETELFFDAIVREDRNILDFLDGRFTYLNERLAKHYGIDGVTGPEFRRVELDGEQRSGVLTQASVLTVSSYPTRTSPVIRGKWVLENLLDQPPPPPPPDVPPLNEEAVGTTASLREQLEQHRANPTCAGCHAPMDPIGFGLENYDAIGRYRTTDGKFPIDSAGVLPAGQSFKGSAELKAILRADPQIFTRALSIKMLTYALGRGVESFDRPAVNGIVAHVRQNGYRFSSLIQAIVESAPFQMRKPQ